MKKIIIAVLMLVAVSCGYSQNVVKEGNVFKTEKTVSRGDTIVTKYQWEDSKGIKYPIIISKKSGACYVWRKSSKSGKMYKQYLGKEITLPICREMGITRVSK